MNDLALVVRLRYGEWRFTTDYWLRVLGAETDQHDVFSRMYLVYLLLLGGLWVVLSASGVAALVHSLGGPVPNAVVTTALPEALTLGLIAWFALSLRQLPMHLSHGDLEWLAPSPISRRALLIPDLATRAVRTGFILGFAGLMLASALHRGPEVAWGALFGAAAAMAAGWGWVLSLWRTIKKGPPLRWLWPVPIVAIPLLLALVPQATGPMRAVADPLAGGSWEIAWLVVILGSVLSWTLIAVLSPAMNLMTVQQGSEVYADIRALGLQFVRNPAAVQAIRRRDRMQRMKARGRLPDWRPPLWEAGRFFWSHVRMPDQALRLIGTGLLFRSALLMAFRPGASLAVLFWLFVRYRVRNPAMSALFHRDWADLFIRQFWRDRAVARFVSATVLPVIVVWLVAVGSFLALPLDAAVTWPHLLFLLGLVLTWHLADGVAMLRNLDRNGTLLGGHEWAVAATGVMLAWASLLHRPWWSLSVPGVLLALLALRWLRSDASPTHEGHPHPVGADGDGGPWPPRS